MSELSPEAEAAANAAALAVENAQEEQETRNIAFAAAEISAESDQVSNEALEVSESAETIAAIASDIAIESDQKSETAIAEAEIAKSEVQQLREEFGQKLDEIKQLLIPPESPPAPEYEEVTTNDDAKHDKETKTGDSGDSGDSDSGTTRTPKRDTGPRGFNRSRRNRN